MSADRRRLQRLLGNDSDRVAGRYRTQNGCVAVMNMQQAIIFGANPKRTVLILKKACYRYGSGPLTGNVGRLHRAVIQRLQAKPFTTARHVQQK